MTITIAAPLVCLVGLLMFLLCDKWPKAVRVGELAFFAGLLVMLLQMGGEHGAKLW